MAFFISKNNGISWNANNIGFGTGSTFSTISALSVIGPNIFAGSRNNGLSFNVWIRPLSEFGIAGVAINPSNQFSVFVSPNPTSAGAVLSFSTSNEGDAKIEVFDVLEIALSQVATKADFLRQPCGPQLRWLDSHPAFTMRVFPLLLAHRR